MLQLSHPTSEINGKIQITGSKSESNRWLILQQLFPNIHRIENLSNSEDTKVLLEALNLFNSRSNIQNKASEINIGHTGTAMRFLTAFFAIQTDVEIILTGSERMQQRPIEPLVTGLNSLGCNISYIKKEGFPPLRIRAKSSLNDELEIRADISSQYITALLLVAPILPNGLKIHFLGELTSRPYIEMTKQQLDSIGIDVKWLDKGLQVSPIKNISEQNVLVESDWSSASYWFSMLALSESSEIELSSYKNQSLQGDASLKQIYAQYFGIQSEIEDDVLKLKKITDFKFPESIELNLNNTPDIAQTIALTCAGLKIKAKLTGLHTLKLKETDRLEAMKNELKKLGVDTVITENSIELVAFNNVNDIPTIETYQDHRMAMAFAPLALKMPLKINDEAVVDKSYPTFWQDLRSVGFAIV
ncbi:3-phosphoshikimate 1-carboxyvinyltransferase [Weeksellaceae bacterium KMM 9724]|uniref:3-phosphoshikimate 1-carboxyvinyltransferase n=1 Tax=Profundicola chukchiensis TaxID=2961959 RepID=UPI00243F5466|nr:3-phosphoshikimate 1-carboxyvinyltransferase [Profundicola chukchiensis]MDG4950374.1 3-phosphoshikimate 1-carboxyvinyltransferase [Profundicola chukchiensis]